MKAQKVKNRPLFYIAERPAEDFLSGVKAGDTLRGRVLKVLPPNKVIVRMRGFNLLAENRSGLKERDRFRASVKRVGPPLALSLLPSTPQDSISMKLKEMGFEPTKLNRRLAQALLAHNLPLNKREMDELLSLWERASHLFGQKEGPDRLRAALLLKKLQISPSSEMIEALKGEELLIGELIDQLASLSPAFGEPLRHLPLDPFDPQLPNKIRRFTEEKKRALKEISSLFRRFSTKAPPQLKDIINNLGYIEDLESSSPEANNTTYHQLPIREGNKLQTFQLKIERRDKVVWFRLLGQTRKIGRVELEAVWGGKKILLRAWAEREKTVSLFEERLPALEERLQALGLRPSTSPVWPRKISLSPLSFLIPCREGEIDLKG